jgi:hypothetical protein
MGAFLMAVGHAIALGCVACGLGDPHTNHTPTFLPLAGCGRAVTGDYNDTTNATVDYAGPDRSVYIRPKYPVHVVAGTAGNGESIDDCSKQADANNWTFSVFRSNDVGYGRLVVPNRTHLQIEFFSVTQDSVLDMFWIQK